MVHDQRGRVRNNDGAPRLRAFIVFVLAVALGLLALAPFGWVAWSIGPLLILLGVIGRRHRSVLANWALWVGAGLTLGVLFYVAIGLLTPDGSGSGSGSGSATL